MELALLYCGGMKATILWTGVATAVLGAGLATAQGTQTPQTNPNDAGASDSQRLPPDTPKWNPGFGEQVPNKELSGNTPSTNSTLQTDRHGNMGKEYFGWLGLLGLAGLFGLSRGTNPSPRPDIREERTLNHLG